MKAKYIVIHSMANNLLIDGKEMTAKEFLKSIGLSAHDLIKSNGEVIKMVNWKKIAHHAGVSEHNGDTNLNKCSIGIELLIDGVNNYADWKKEIELPEAFSDKHYEKCAELCASYCFEFDLVPEESILLHSEVSSDEVRGEGKGKIDPGKGFDHQRLISMTQAELIRYPKK